MPADRVEFLLFLWILPGFPARSIRPWRYFQFFQDGWPLTVCDVHSFYFNHMLSLVWRLQCGATHIHFHVRKTFQYNVSKVLAMANFIAFQWLKGITQNFWYLLLRIIFDTTSVKRLFLNKQKLTFEYPPDFQNINSTPKFCKKNWRFLENLSCATNFFAINCSESQIPKHSILISSMGVYNLPMPLPDR